MNRYKMHVVFKFKIGDSVYLNEKGTQWNGLNNVKHGNQLHLFKSANIYMIGQHKVDGYIKGWKFDHEHTWCLTTSHLEGKIRRMFIPTHVLEEFYEHEPIQTI